MAKIIRLTQNDLDRILEVETGAFIPPLQASKETILKRLNLNHVYLGSELDGQLIGTLAFRYSTFSPEDLANFPRTFDEFANDPNTEQANAMFGYSLGFIPESRGRSTLELMDKATEFAKMNSMEYVVAEGRCPSYNGSDEFPQEIIMQNPEFRKILDESITKGITPSKRDLLKDPNLAFYILFAKGEPLTLIPNFNPEDKPSGGHRILLYKKLK